ASLLLIEVRAESEGFDLLNRLRRAKQTCPALVISGSWELRNEALRLRTKLGIAEVLAASQPLMTVQKAVARALGPVVETPPPPPPPEEPSFTEKPRKAELPSEKELLEDMLGQTARSLRASMALAWPDDG